MVRMFVSRPGRRHSSLNHSRKKVINSSQICSKNFIKFYHSLSHLIPYVWWKNILSDSLKFSTQTPKELLQLITSYYVLKLITAPYPSCSKQKYSHVLSHLVTPYLTCSIEKYLLFIYLFIYLFLYLFIYFSYLFIHLSIIYLVLSF